MQNRHRKIFHKAKANSLLWIPAVHASNKAKNSKISSHLQKAFKLLHKSINSNSKYLASLNYFPPPVPRTAIWASWIHWTKTFNNINRTIRIKKLILSPIICLSTWSWIHFQKGVSDLKLGFTSRARLIRRCGGGATKPFCDSVSGPATENDRIRTSALGLNWLRLLAMERIMNDS